MSEKFHINKDNGNVGPCSATVKSCPHGGPADHYSSEDKARAAFELSMKGEEMGSLKAERPDLFLRGRLTEQFCRIAEAQSRHAVNAISGAFTKLNRDGFYELDAEVANTVWSNPESALRMTQRLELLRKAMANKVWSETVLHERRRSTVKHEEKIADSLDYHLEQIPFHLLSENYNEHSDLAREKWLSLDIDTAKADKAGLENASVPCDGDHGARVARDGYCRKCGGA